MTAKNFLDEAGLTASHKALFNLGMDILDANYRPPLLFSSAKLSSWYSVGLLARDQPGDVERAKKLLANSLHLQELDSSFEQNYGSFKKHAVHPWSSGKNPLWVGEIYDSYGEQVTLVQEAVADEQIRTMRKSNTHAELTCSLFFTMAGMQVLDQFSDKLDSDLIEGIKKAMHTACIGNAKRHGGWHGDDMWPSYTNPWFLRCVCSTYTGHMMGDKQLIEQAEGWVQEAVELFDRDDTPGEFNSPTYAGVTLMALALAKFCPPESAISKVAPRLMKAIWESQAETYNPSLKNVAGPWDRSYGYCMTQYYATVAANIASVVGIEDAPMPSPLNGSDHFTDAALIPMQMLTAPYTEADLSDETRAKFKKLYAPHMYTPRSTFPPHDRKPRRYTYWLEEGLSIGGVEFDEDRIGGPKGIPAQFNPGVIQWDSGNHGSGCGWISVWPENACTSFIASKDSLTVRYLTPTDFPGSPTSNRVAIRFGCLPGLHLDHEFLADGKASLPGLDIHLSGSIVDKGDRAVSFSLAQKIHGAYYYEVVYTFPDSLRETEAPTLVIGVTKTQPPASLFLM